jgi:hypothetical protein
MQNLEFPQKGSSATGLTQIFEVRSVHTGILLGEISWYARWRRYAFYPDAGNLLDAECLREIAKFLDDIMMARKQDPQLR